MNTPQRRSVRLIRTPVLVAALALVVVACGTGPGRTGETGGASDQEVFTATGDPLAPRPLDEPTTITVGVGTELEVYAQFMLAQAMGEFEAENLVVKSESVGESDRLALLAQGRLDVVYNAMTAGLLNLISTGANVKWAFPGAAYGPESHQGYWFNRATFGPDGPQPAELRGKEILTPSGSAAISAYYLWEWVQREDPSVLLDELDFTHLAPNDIAIAMVNGAADSAMVVSPGSEILEKDDCCEFVDVGYPSTPVIGWVGSEDFLNEKTEAAMAFFRALARTTQKYLQGDYHSDPKVAPVLAEQMGISTEKLKSLPHLLFDPSFDLAVEHLGAQEYWRKLGLLNYEEDLNTDDVYDTRFVEYLRKSAPRD